MAAEIPDASTIEVANSASPTQPVAPTAPDDLNAFLNAEPDEFDAPPKREAQFETVKERKVAETPVVKHHPRLVEAAKQVGLEDHIIAKLSPDDLTDAVFNLERKWRHLDTNDTRRHQEQRPQAPKEPEPPVVDEDEEALQALETEGYDPRLLKLLRATKKKAVDVEATVTRSTQSDMERRRGEALEAVEDAMASLGPKFERIVGKGAITEVDEGAKEIRNAIFSQANVSPMDSPRTIARKITLAANKLYGKLLAEAPAADPVAEAYGKKPAAPAKANGKVYTEEEWDRAGLAKPTATNVPKPRGARAAAQAVAARMQDFGVSRGIDDDEFDGLPG